MASRSLKDLHPAIERLAVMHVSACKAAGIDLLIYCTYRSSKEQAVEYARGRVTFGIPCRCGKRVNDKPRMCSKHPLGLKSTNAGPGKSPHNNTDPKGKPASMAYDCVPIVNGKPNWDDDKLLNKVGELGEKIGLVWGGRWKSADKPHFQISL